FGVAGVGALYAFVSARLGARAALAAGALLAVSYHHVFFSQNARGFTALVFLGLLASGAVFRLRSTPSGRGRWLAYGTCAALAAYAVALGVFVLLGHAAAVAGAWIARRRRGGAGDFDARAFLAGAVLAAGLIAVLYAPFLRPLARVTAARARSPVAAARAGRARLHRLGVAADAVEGLARGFGGPVGLAVAAALASVGAVAWAVRDPLSLAVLASPVALEAAVLLAAN